MLYGQARRIRAAAPRVNTSCACLPRRIESSWLNILYTIFIVFPGICIWHIQGNCIPAMNSADDTTPAETAMDKLGMHIALPGNAFSTSEIERIPVVSSAEDTIPIETIMDKLGTQIANRERLFFYRHIFVRTKKGKFEMQTGIEAVTFEQLLPNDWLTAADLKRYFSCSWRTLRRWISTRGLEPDGWYKHRLLFYKSTVLRWDSFNHPRVGRPKGAKGRRVAG